VTRLGITGHTDLAADTAVRVGAEVRALVAAADPPLVGVTCLAPGADRIFADAVLDEGGHIEVVLPSADYREAKVPSDQRPHFDALVERASAVHVMPFAEAGRAAYQAANEAMIANVDRLLAVWDGTPSDRPGSAGDAVASATARGLPVTVVWPDGAQRRG
jgi:hypothetical protein